MSLRTRDPGAARRAAWRLHAEFEKLTENGTADMDPTHVTELLNQVMVHDLGAHLDRLDRDLTQQLPLRYLNQDDLLHDRVRELRIEACLYRLASERGFGLRFGDELHAELKRGGYTAFERQRIREQIERGFLRRLIVPDESGTDMPPFSSIRERAEAQGDASPKNILGIYTAIAAEKSNTLDRMATNYEAARRYPDSAVTVVRRARNNELLRDQPGWAAPTFSAADAIDRGQIIVPPAGHRGSVPDRNLASGRPLKFSETATVAPVVSPPPRNITVAWTNPLPVVTSPSHTQRQFAAAPAPAPALVRDPVTSAPEASPSADPAFSPWQAHHASSTAPPRVLIAPARDAKRSFYGLIERLIASRTDWGEETRRQHRSVARLLALTVGSDDVADFTQAHIGEYVTNLSLLPKTYGKSDKDEFKSLSEILSRASLLDPPQVGLLAPTINRHLTQLGTILKFADLYGFNIGDAATLTRMRRDDRRPANSLRGVFTDDEIVTLFKDELWTTSTSRIALAGLRDTWGGELPCLYWMPLLALYSFARLSELCYLRTSDIDVEKGMIVLVDFELRKLKTVTSERRIPLHPELLRLGFLNYVSDRAREGSELLFPDLRARGHKAALGDLFDTLFAYVLDRALPDARKEKKTFHSIRHFGNGVLIGLLVLDPIREALFGHSGKTVNTRNYSHVDDNVLRSTIGRFPSFTAHIKPIY